MPIHPPPRMIRRATWSWTTVPRFAGFSTTTRAVRSTRPGCEWPTGWTRSGSRSDGTWTRKRGFAERQLNRLAACIDKGLDLVRPQQETIRCHVETIQEVAATLDPAAKTSARRQSDFDAILARIDDGSDPIRTRMAVLMRSFRAGLFAGDDAFDQIRDNLDLERWFRLLKGHERRIHGHRHAGVRIVQEGPTLVHALDAHHSHPEAFGVDDLLPYRSARAPACQRQAIHRRKVMRKARSRTKRPKLLADLERRYQAASSRL